MVLFVKGEQLRYNPWCIQVLQRYKLTPLKEKVLRVHFNIIRIVYGHKDSIFKRFILEKNPTIITKYKLIKCDKEKAFIYNKHLDLNDCE